MPRTTYAPAAIVMLKCSSQQSLGLLLCIQRVEVMLPDLFLGWTLPVAHAVVIDGIVGRVGFVRARVFGDIPSSDIHLGSRAKKTAGAMLALSQMYCRCSVLPCM